MKHFTLLLFTGLCQIVFAQNQVPVISNFNASAGGGQVNITYDLSDAENNPCDVSLLVSSNGGQTYLSKAGTITGDVGTGIVPGTGKQITWNYDTVSNIFAYSLRLVADDKQLPDIQDIVDAVDSNRLRSNLEFVSGIRHYTANPAHLEEVKDSIWNSFVSAGLNTYTQDFTKSGYLGQNVIGRKAGLGKEDSTYIIDAHFDSVSDAPGADDNGSGVVGFLEALRVLAPYNFAKTIRFIGFDFEETVGIAGLEGSIRYTQSGIPSWEKIQGVANFEMIGYYSNVPNSQQVPTGFNFIYPAEYATLQADSFRGNFIVNAGDEESEGFMLAYKNLAATHVPALKVTSLKLVANGLIAPDFRRSDHAPFWDLNVPALLLTDGANFRNHNYHSPADSIGTLNFTFMSNVVKAAVATVATLAEIQHSSFSDFSLSQLSVPTNNPDCQAELSPVPVHDVITVHAGDCFEGGFLFSIINSEGREVLPKTQVTKSVAGFATSRLPAGIYFGILENGKGKAVRKFVKK